MYWYLFRIPGIEMISKKRFFNYLWLWIWIPWSRFWAQERKSILNLRIKIYSKFGRQTWFLDLNTEIEEKITEIWKEDKEFFYVFQLVVNTTFSLFSSASVNLQNNAYFEIEGHFGSCFILQEFFVLIFKKVLVCWWQIRWTRWVLQKFVTQTINKIGSIDKTLT